MIATEETAAATATTARTTAYAAVGEENAKVLDAELEETAAQSAYDQSEATFEGAKDAEDQAIRDAEEATELAEAVDQEAKKATKDLEFKGSIVADAPVELVMCVARFVDCKARGGYDPKDMCQQTCVQPEVVPVTTGPVMCVKRYVDCSKRGGYDAVDTCNQTCVFQEDQKVEEIICTAEFLDCSQRGGYDLKADPCKQKCMEPEPKFTHKYLADGAIELAATEVAKIVTDIQAAFIEGPQKLEAVFKQQYTQMMEYNIALKAEKDNLDLQYKVAYMRTRYGHMKEAAHHAREADMLANKARYELEAKKAEAALRAKEEAETAAFEKEEAVLLEEFQEAAGGENTEQAVAALLTRQQDNYDRSVAWAKKAAADTSMSARSKVMAQRSAQWEQRKYTTLKNEVNLETEKREKAKQAAIQASEDAEDRRNAVELTTTERAALYDDIKKSTYVRLTGDATRDLVLQKDSLKKMQEVAERYKAQADSVKDFMSRAKLTEEAYAEKKEEYYKIDS